MDEKKIPYFACEIHQGDNVIKVPITYGALENMCRALLAHNEGTAVCIVGTSMMSV